MNELFPIIRRKRRPLIVESVPDRPTTPPMVAGNVEPVKVEAVVSREGNAGGEEQTNHASTAQKD